MRKALIRDADGFVVNVIEWEPESAWEPPAGHSLIDAGDGSPGDTWDGEKFIKPPPPPEPEPPRSTHFARIESFTPTAEKPLKVKRTWNGKDYFFDCFATQTLKDEYQAGSLAIGDWVIVHIDDSDREVAMLKIFKSW